jgi:hypothetical protein
MDAWYLGNWENNFMHMIKLTGWPLWLYALMGSFILLIPQAYFFWFLLPYLAVGGLFYTGDTPISVYNFSGKKLWAVIVLPYIIVLLVVKGILGE